MKCISLLTTTSTTDRWIHKYKCGPSSKILILFLSGYFLLYFLDFKVISNIFVHEGVYQNWLEIFFHLNPHFNFVMDVLLQLILKDNNLMAWLICSSAYLTHNCPLWSLNTCLIYHYLNYMCVQAFTGMSNTHANKIYMSLLLILLFHKYYIYDD